MVSRALDAIGSATQFAVEALPQIPEWQKWGFPSEAAWKAAGSPQVPFSEWSAMPSEGTTTGAAVFSNPVLSPTSPVPDFSMEEYPQQYAQPAQPGGYAQQYTQPIGPQSLQEIADEKLEALGGGIARGLGSAASTLGSAADTAFSALEDVPISSVPGVGTGATILNAVAGNGGLGDQPTLGTTAKSGYEAYMADVPVVSPFLREEVAPRAGSAVGEVFSSPINPAAPVINAAAESFGTPSTQQIGQAVGEGLTPVTAGDIALSVFVPATADWADVYRLAKNAGLVDDAGRVVARMTAKGSLDEILQRFGRSVDDLPELPRGAASALVRGTPVDQGTDATRLLAGPGAGVEVPAPRPGIAGGADEASRIDAAITDYKRIIANDEQLLIDYPDAAESIRRDIEQHKAALARLEDAKLRGGDLQEYQGQRLPPKAEARAAEGLRATEKRLLDDPAFREERAAFRRANYEANIKPVVEDVRRMAAARRADEGLTAGRAVEPPAGTAGAASAPSGAPAAPGAGRVVPAPRPGIAGASDELASASMQQPAPDDEVRALREFLGGAPEGGSVPASSIDATRRSEQFAAEINSPTYRPTTQSAIGSHGLPIESVQEAIDTGRRLGYSDADIAAYLRRNYDEGAGGAAGARPRPPGTPPDETAGLAGMAPSPAGAVDELVTGVGGTPPASAAPAPSGGTPSPPTTTATAVAEQPDPVRRLTDLVNEARPLPAQTEAVRKAERAQRVAAMARIQEEGGFTDEAFRRGQAMLGGEYGRAAFDPVTPNFSPEDVQQFRNMIGESGLRPLERNNANIALNAVLEGRLNEVRPFEIALLDKVYGPEFSLAVASKAAPPSLADKAHEFWVASILSGPDTFVRNIGGNTAAAMLGPPETGFAAAIEPLARRLTGRETERWWQEVPAQIHGMLVGIPDGVTAALKTARTGVGEAALTEAVRPQAIGGRLGRIIRLPFTGLEMMDSFFGAINFEGARRALAVRMARNEGLTGRALQLRIADLMANSPDELLEAATEQRLMRLFRDDPTRFGQWIMDGRKSVPGMRFLVPFARTPDRLVAFGIRRSPLGLLDLPMWQRLVRGNPQAVDELAQTLMGSTVAMGLGALVATGQLDIIGSFPSLPAARDRLYREGKLPFSVNVPGLGWVQYSQIPGLDVALTSLAAAKEAWENGESPDRAIAELGGDIAQNIFDRSYVSGISDFMEIFSSGGYEDPVDAAQRWAGRQISGGVPFSALFRQGSQYFDPTIYKPEGMVEELATGVGLGGPAGVPPRLTAFGEESQRAPVRAPVGVSPETQTRVDAALEASGVEVNFVGKSIGGRELNREQQFAYQQAAGRQTYDSLYTVVSSSIFDQLSDVQKAGVLNASIDETRRRITREVSALLDSEVFQALPEERQNRLLLLQLQTMGEVRGRESPVTGENVLRITPEPVNTFGGSFQNRAEGAPLSASTRSSFTYDIQSPFAPSTSTDQYRPEVNPQFALVEARSIARRAGLPDGLLELPAYINTPTDPERPAGWYAPSINAVYAQDMQIGEGGKLTRYQTALPIHEAIHALESNLTTEERREMQRLLRAQQPPAGAPKEHHPDSITAYFDYLFGPWVANGREGQKTPQVPTEVQAFVRRVIDRIEEEALP